MMMLMALEIVCSKCCPRFPEHPYELPAKLQFFSGLYVCEIEAHTHKEKGSITFLPLLQALIPDLYSLLALHLHLLTDFTTVVR